MNNRISKILQKHLPTASNFIGNDSPTGLLQGYLIWISIISKTLEWLLPKILFTMKVEITFTKFAHIYVQISWIIF